VEMIRTRCGDIVSPYVRDSVSTTMFAALFPSTQSCPIQS
jgi:preprotein translocase subunit SecB